MFRKSQISKRKRSAAALNEVQKELDKLPRFGGTEEQKGWRMYYRTQKRRLRSEIYGAL